MFPGEAPTIGGVRTAPQSGGENSLRFLNIAFVPVPSQSLTEEKGRILVGFMDSEMKT